MTPERAMNLVSLSTDVRWRDFISHVEDLQKQHDAVIHYPKTSYEMTQYHRGFYDFAEMIKGLPKEAYEICRNMKTETEKER